MTTQHLYRLRYRRRSDGRVASFDVHAADLQEALDVLTATIPELGEYLGYSVFYGWPTTP